MRPTAIEHGRLTRLVVLHFGEPDRVGRTNPPPFDGALFIASGDVLHDATQQSPELTLTCICTLQNSAGLQALDKHLLHRVTGLAGEQAAAPADFEVAECRYSKQRSQPAEPSHRASHASNCCIAARKRVFLVDVLQCPHCPHCGGARRLLAAVYDPLSIEAVLRAMGLAPEAPELAPARAPPGCDQAWFGA